jgi:CDP-glycerol glycerophosphotransferase
MPAASGSGHRAIVSDHPDGEGVTRVTEPAPSTPDVTVVVIVYNDAKRLPTAVRSVLRQTLRSVEVVISDDASTDATPEVAAALEAEDPRVRYLRLPENSGGCGRPRNVGVEHARGRYVMFLDSDDRLERHACKNLLEALEDNDADFSMGLVRRHYTEDGRQTLWFRELFEERRVVGGLEENPELIQDVLSVNKLYRRTFLDEHQLTFPEDVHYEDQLFSFKAYHRARRIAIIPENVYLWRIFPPAKGRSITQQRHQIENFHHRLVVHRRLDDYIAEHGTPELQRVKDLKFLENDMRLYLADVIDGDGTVTAEVLVEAEDYLRAIPEDRYQSLPLPLRAAYGMALRHDPEGLRQVMLLDRRNILAPRLSEHEGTTYLSNRLAPPGPDPAFALDAPENTYLVADGSPLLTAPVGTFHLWHELTGVQTRHGAVRLSGTTYDALGKLAASGGRWSLRISAKRAATRERVEFPVTVDSVEGDLVRWHAVVRAGHALAPIEPDVRWALSVRTQIRNHTSQTPLIWGAGLTAVTMPVPPSAKLGLAISGTVGPGSLGNTEVELTSSPGLRRKVTNRLSKRYLPVWEERVAERWTRVEKGRVLRRFYTAMRRLPLDHGLVVFEANMGKIYGDSPKYVYEAMRRTHPHLKAVWVLPKGHPPPHPDVKVVRRGTGAYMHALARAAYWVDNQTFPRYVRKRPGQRYLQTWHGIPLKKMGRDKLGERLPKQLPDRGTGAWDELVVPNPYFEQTFVPAFDYRKGLVRYGTPRNDVLVDGSLTVEQARRELDLPLGARVILYAPTFREDNSNRRVPVTVPFDIAALLESFDDDTYVLLRPHYLNRISVPATARHRTLDVSKVEDVNLLYVASDILITDYSSVMFDYALLRRPIVFFTYDYTEYLASRGTYFDLIDAAPGPLARTTDELVAAVHEVVATPGRYAAKYEEFLASYCGDEDGTASERAVRRLLDEEVAS